MIQGAINQLIGIAAAAKKTSDATKRREAKAAAKSSSNEQASITKAVQAKNTAMARMAEKVQEKWDQNEEFKKHINMVGPNAPDLVKQLAFEKWKETPKDVSIGGSKVDISKLSPEAQAALREGVQNG